MVAKTKAAQKAPASSKSDESVNDPANVDPALAGETKQDDATTQPDATQTDDAGTAKAETPKAKTKAADEFKPCIALIKKYDDKIPSQVTSQAQLDELIAVHGAENIEVQE